MKIIDLKNIVRKDSPIHYINEYHGILEYELDGNLFEELIEIILEKTALGTTNIQLHVKDENLKKNLTVLDSYINEKNKQGIFS